MSWSLVGDGAPLLATQAGMSTQGKYGNNAAARATQAPSLQKLSPASPAAAVAGVGRTCSTACRCRRPQTASSRPSCQ